MSASYETCPTSAPFFGFMGVMNPQLVMRNIIPVVMAGVLGIYGLIVAVIIQGSSRLNFHISIILLFLYPLILYY